MSQALNRFIKYSSIGLATFLLDLLLLYILTDLLLVNYVAAAGVAFFIAVTINYGFSRKYVFKNTQRGVKEGYINFLLIVLVGSTVVMGGMYVLVTYLGFNYLISRVSVAAVTGFWNYLMNLFVNFKVAGIQ
jgi:putative flippase GtrA